MELVNGMLRYVSSGHGGAEHTHTFTHTQTHTDTHRHTPMETAKAMIAVIHMTLTNVQNPAPAHTL